MPARFKRTMQKPFELAIPELNALERYAGTKRRRVHAKTPLFVQGATADALYYIIQGKVQITVLSGQGREGMIGFIAGGGFVGEISLTAHERYLETATTFTECQVLKIPAARWPAALADSPGLLIYFTNFLLRHSIDIQADLVDHLFNSSERRLARILLILANYDGSGRLDEIPHMTQELLAERVGTTRARVSFFMNKFRRLGLIDYNGHIKVHSGLLNLILQDVTSVSGKAANPATK